MVGGCIFVPMLLLMVLLPPTGMVMCKTGQATMELSFTICVAVRSCPMCTYLSVCVLVWCTRLLLLWLMCYISLTVIALSKCATVKHMSLTNSSTNPLLLSCDLQPIRWQIYCHCIIVNKCLRRKTCTVWRCERRLLLLLFLMRKKVGMRSGAISSTMVWLADWKPFVLLSSHWFSPTKRYCWMRWYCTCLLICHRNPQGCSKIFQGCMAKVYIPRAVSRGVWGHASPANFLWTEFQ